MILRIDHVAIAVKDYEKAFNFFTRLLGAVPGTYAKEAPMKYLWQNMALGDLSRLEILTPTGQGSFLDNFLKDKDGGVHHMNLQTSDIYKTKQMLEDNDIPYFGFNDYGPFWKELFIHPRDAFGVLIQIAEFEADDWISPEVKMPYGRRWNVNKQATGCSLVFAHPGGGKVTMDLDRQEVGNLIQDLQEVL